MVVLLGRFGYARMCARRTGPRQNIAHKHAPTRRRFTAANGSKYAYACKSEPASAAPSAHFHPAVAPCEETPNGRGADHDRLRQLRPHPRRSGTAASRWRAATSPICRSIRRRSSSAPSAIRSSTSRSCRSRATSARWRPAPRPMSASRPSCRGCSGIPASTCAPIPASASPRTCAASASALPEYQITAVVWMRGMMQHEYGVKPTEIHWRSGGQEEAGRDERTPLKPIPGLDLKPIGKDQTLVDMLRDGELDALFTARGAVIVPARRAAHQAAVSQHPRGRAGLLQEDPHVPAHAPRRHPQGAGAEISLARRPASTRRSAKPRRSP